MPSEYLLIGADIVPTKSNQKLFISGDVRTLVGGALLEELRNASYRIFNLEAPLTDCPAPIDKAGPNLIAPVAASAGLKALGTDLLTLANNHIMDQGVAGFQSTIDELERQEIAYVGGGQNLREAQKAFVIKVANRRIGVYACAEHEFSIAAEDTPGANPFDPLYSLDHIVELKAISDYVIVLYHGMKEYYRLPTPCLQKTLRRMIDKGADLVVCQHNHCIGCEEHYRSGTIIYGQGNFIFDSGNDEYWNSSLLLRLDFAGTVKISYIPVVKRGGLVRMAEGEERRQLLRDFYERSELIKDQNYIEAAYDETVNRELESRLRVVSGIGRGFIFRVMNKLVGEKLIFVLYGKRELLGLRNYIECEVHHECLMRGINNRLKMYNISNR